MKSTAAGLAALGRGPDSMLVHMSPREVQGLQQLAMAHGGSLTTNPHTGLPEAGFLSSIIPMVAGAALAATGVGAPMAALMVGGIGAMATGSLGKGLMMGLGAYGGAGLGSALSAAGSVGAEAGAAGLAETTGNAAVDVAARQAAQTAAIPGFPSSAAEINAANALAGDTAAQAAIDTANPAFAGNPAATMRQTPSFSNMGRGVSNVFSGSPVGDQARNAFMQDLGGMKGLAKTGAMAAAPMLTEALKPEDLNAPPKAPTQFYKTSFTQQRNPRWGEPGQPYFIQSYAPGTLTTNPNEVTAPRTGIGAFADGGYVPESGSIRIPTPEDERNESRVPDTKIKFAGYAPEKASALKNMSELQLKLIAARSNDPEQKGAAIRELYVRQGTQQPGSQFVSSEKFMADGGVVPAPQATPPQMPTSPLFQQVRSADPAALDDYLAGLGRNLMGTQPQTPGAAGFGMASMNPAGIIPSAGAFSLPQSQIPATNQYGYNPATQTFFANPNYVAPVDSSINTGLDSLDNSRYSGDGDAAGGPIKAKYAAGGLGSLPEYAAGGKLLDGPGDGVSDSIPAVIKGPKPQRAALADGEFVIPARIVSELGNGSTKAGAKRLYAMMDRVQKARQKTTGKDKVAVNTNPNRLLPA